MPGSPTGQKIVIPKGLVNPNETTIVEIPEELQNVGTVVALPKEDMSPPRQPYNLPGRSARHNPPSMPSPQTPPNRPPRNKLVKKRSYTKRTVPCGDATGAGYEASTSAHSENLGSPLTSYDASFSLSPRPCSPCKPPGAGAGGGGGGHSWLDQYDTPPPLSDAERSYRPGFDTKLSMMGDPQYADFRGMANSTRAPMRQAPPGYSPTRGPKNTDTVPSVSLTDSELSAHAKFYPEKCSSQIPESIPSGGSYYEESGGMSGSGGGSGTRATSGGSYMTEGGAMSGSGYDRGNKSLSYADFCPEIVSSHPFPGGSDFSDLSSANVDSSVVDQLSKLEEQELSNIVQDLSNFQSSRRKLIVDAASLKSAADFTLSSLEDSGGAPTGGVSYFGSSTSGRSSARGSPGNSGRSGQGSGQGSGQENSNCRPDCPSSSPARSPPAFRHTFG